MIRITDPCGYLVAREYKDSEIEDARKEVSARIEYYGTRQRVRIHVIQEVSIDDFLKG